MAKHRLTRRDFFKCSAPALLLAAPIRLPRATASPSRTTPPVSRTAPPGSRTAPPVSRTAASASRTTDRGFVDLFDGKSLSGWHTNEEKIGHGTGGRWQVENGVLTGEQDPPGSGNGGILMTDKSYGDFELRLDLAPDWGIDSGVFLRTNSKGECFQVYVDYRNGGHVGFISTERAGGAGRMYIRPFYIDGVQDESGKLRGFQTKPDERELAWKPGFFRYHCSPEEWKSAWKIGRWNNLRIRCVGQYPEITTWINDTKIAQFDGAASPHPMNKKEELYEVLGREGAIALQVHGGKGWPEGAKCRWKNIQIKTL